MKRTTDEWTEEFYAKFAKDVDARIKMLTDLKGEEAYTLRRHIMMSLRHGPCSANTMTEEIDKLRARDPIHRSGLQRIEEHADQHLRAWQLSNPTLHAFTNPLTAHLMQLRNSARRLKGLV